MNNYLRISFTSFQLQSILMLVSVSEKNILETTKRCVIFKYHFFRRYVENNISRVFNETGKKFRMRFGIFSLTTSVFLFERDMDVRNGFKVTHGM